MTTIVNKTHGPVPSIYSSARKVGLQRAAETARTALGPGSLPKGRICPDSRGNKNGVTSG